MNAKQRQTDKHDEIYNKDICYTLNRKKFKIFHLGFPLFLFCEHIIAEQLSQNCHTEKKLYQYFDSFERSKGNRQEQVKQKTA